MGGLTFIVEAIGVDCAESKSVVGRCLDAVLRLSFLAQLSLTLVHS